MFSITIDTEWVPQELLDETVSILNDYSINATFFVTNKYDFSKFSTHELAIHPNFDKDGTFQDILEECFSYLPSKNSKGSRSHSLFNSTPMFTEYENFGIEYDSNYFIPCSKSPRPFIFDGIDVVEIPIFFADDNKLYSKNFKWDPVSLENDGCKVFLFHPSHIFLNTFSLEHYNEMKKCYHEYDKLLKIRNNNSTGIRNLFIDLLDYIEKNNIDTKTMNEINTDYRKNLEFPN